jgi:hypothetical protein
MAQGSAFVPIRQIIFVLALPTEIPPLPDRRPVWQGSAEATPSINERLCSPPRFGQRLPQSIEAVMQPPARGATRRPGAGAVSSRMNRGSTRRQDSTAVQGGVIGQPKVVAEPQDRGGGCRHRSDVGTASCASMFALMIGMSAAGLLLSHGITQSA